MSTEFKKRFVKDRSESENMFKSITSPHDGAMANILRTGHVMGVELKPSTVGQARFKSVKIKNNAK